MNNSFEDQLNIRSEESKSFTKAETQEPLNISIDKPKKDTPNFFWNSASRGTYKRTTPKPLSKKLRANKKKLEDRLNKLGK